MNIYEIEYQYQDENNFVLTEYIEVEAADFAEAESLFTEKAGNKITSIRLEE